MKGLKLLRLVRALAADRTQLDLNDKLKGVPSDGQLPEDAEARVARRALAVGGSCCAR
jgi:hypothetical protein